MIRMSLKLYMFLVFVPWAILISSLWFVKPFYNWAYSAGLETGSWGYERLPLHGPESWHSGIPDTIYRDGYDVVTKIDTFLMGSFVRISATGQYTMKKTDAPAVESTFTYESGWSPFYVRTYRDSVYVGDSALFLPFHEIDVHQGVDTE